MWKESLTFHNVLCIQSVQRSRVEEKKVWHQNRSDSWGRIKHLKYFVHTCVGSGVHCMCEWSVMFETKPTRAFLCACSFLLLLLFVFASWIFFSSASMIRWIGCPQSKQTHSRGLSVFRQQMHRSPPWPSILSLSGPFSFSHSQVHLFSLQHPFLILHYYPSGSDKRKHSPLEAWATVNFWHGFFFTISGCICTNRKWRVTQKT